MCELREHRTPMWFTTNENATNVWHRCRNEKNSKNIYNLLKIRNVRHLVNDDIKVNAKSENCFAPMLMAMEHTRDMRYYAPCARRRKVRMRARKSPKKLWVRRRRGFHFSVKLVRNARTMPEATTTIVFVRVCVCVGSNRNNARSNRSICPSLIFFFLAFFPHLHSVRQSFVFPFELRRDEPKH